MGFLDAGASAACSAHGVSSSAARRVKVGFIVLGVKLYGCISSLVVMRWRSSRSVLPTIPEA
ncbi:MAG: hypothetical protein ACK56I_08375 [bacterium]